MRYAIYGAFFLSVLCFCGAQSVLEPGSQELSVHFSPDGGCTESIVAAAAAAKNKIYVQAYVLTSKPIAKALADARARGVDVEVILDGKGSRMNGSRYAWLISQGVKVTLDKAHPIAHNKVILIDSAKVITGSFNFSDQAEEKNAENLLEVNNEAIAKEYEKNWLSHRKHSFEQISEEATPKAAETTTTPEKGNVCENGNCMIPQGVSRFRRR